MTHSASQVSRQSDNREQREQVANKDPFVLAQKAKAQGCGQAAEGWKARSAAHRRNDCAYYARLVSRAGDGFLVQQVIPRMT